MEAVTTMSEGEWNFSFNGMCSEEADFMAQLLGSCSIPNEVPSGNNFAVSSTFWPIHESNMNNTGESVMYSSEETNTSMYSCSQGSSYGTRESYYPSVIPTTNNFMTMDYSNNVMGGGDFLNQDDSNGSMGSEKKLSENVLQGENNFHLGDKASKPSEMSKKRPRVPGEVHKSKRSMKLKKCAKVEANDEENNDNNNKNNTTNAVFHRPRASSCCSEDESNASHEMNGAISSSSNLTGKTRASRGSATDPQSLYARKRRERINERLRILQNLVPNGTKVDISTMLEEAVQYVKFLQLQIKLLSSDDLWMYAPIAYNGMDLGLDLNMSTPKSQS